MKKNDVDKMIETEEIVPRGKPEYVSGTLIVLVDKKYILRQPDWERIKALRAAIKINRERSRRVYFSLKTAKNQRRYDLLCERAVVADEHTKLQAQLDEAKMALDQPGIEVWRREYHIIGRPLDRMDAAAMASAFMQKHAG